MSRGSVPRGSVGRAELARDLEPGEVDESVPPKAAASVPWVPKEIGTKAKSPPPTLSSGGASQPAGGTAFTVDLHVGCFNIGIEQAMLGNKNHTKNFRRILGKGFAEDPLLRWGLLVVALLDENAD